MRRILLGTAGLVLGAGVAILAMPAVASAQSASTSTACRQLQATLSKINTTLPQAATNPKALSSKISTFVRQLEQAAASAPPAVKSAVTTFVTDLKAAGAGHPNVAKLTSDGNAIGAACSAQATTPSGAPATGGGSTAGIQDPALFALGGAAVLAGAGALGLASRRRRRTRA